MRLLSVEKMKQLEEAANKGGYTFEKMMDKAGNGLAEIVDATCQHLEAESIVGLVGGGNNGGDTLIALTELMQRGWNCSAILIKPESLLAKILNTYQKKGGRIVEFKSESLDEIIEQIVEADVILDGFFGTGFQPPIKPPLDEFFRFLIPLMHNKFVFAVDCPSGVDCRTGEAAEEALSADMTVCMDAVKEGMLCFPAFLHCGDLVTVDLGIPAKYKKETDSPDFVIDPIMVRKGMPERRPDSHKGTYGHLLLCGGSANYVGAPILAGRSAYRTGAGLVETAIPERIYEITAGSHLESTWLLLEDDNGVIAETAAPTLIPRLEQVTSLVIGPGMGREETTAKFLSRVLLEKSSQNSKSKVGFLPLEASETKSVLKSFPPAVIDADGLWLLSKISKWFEKLPTQVILTPHPGEMAVLTGLSVEEIQNDRRNIARRFALEWKQVVVLKGALTVVALPDGRVGVMPFADDALAKAGTGDVLAGIIGGLLAQGTSLSDAAICGVWLHAQAALLAKEHVGSGAGVIASDIIDAIPEALL